MCRKHKAALECFNKAIMMNPNKSIYHENMGMVFYEMYNYGKAIKCFDAAIRIDPNSADLHYMKGKAMHGLGKYEAAMECFDEVIRHDKNNDNAHVYRGSALGAIGDYQGAIKSFDEAITINPGHGVAHINKSTCLLKDGSPDRALDEIDIALNVADAGDRSLAVMRKSDILYMLCRPGDAMKCLDTIAEGDPLYADALLLKGVLNEEHYNFHRDELSGEEAKRHYSAAEKARPGFSNEKYREGMSSYKRGDMRDAKDSLYKAIRLRPHFPDAMRFLGMAHHALDMSEDGIAYCEMAIDQRPGFAEAICSKAGDTALNWQN